MKIRTGFVSNSSSSSFCLFGVPIKNISDFDTEHHCVGMGVPSESDEGLVEIFDITPEMVKFFKQKDNFDRCLESGLKLYISLHTTVDDCTTGIPLSKVINRCSEYHIDLKDIFVVSGIADQNCYTIYPEDIEVNYICPKR